MLGYGYWNAYLAQGKHKAATVERPINGKLKHRVHRLGEDIALRLHYTDVVIFHVDGTVTYDTGGWNTVTTRRFINEHGPVRVHTEKGDLYFGHQIGTSPERVAKCRTCSGAGTTPRECYGPSWCYIWPAGGIEQCAHGQTTNHRRELCGHGQREGHPLPPVKCWRCDGVGRTDYGSRPLYLPWDGDKYRFHPDDVVTQIQKPTTIYAVSGSDSGPSYSDSGKVLTELLPGLSKPSVCPVKGCGDLGTVRAVIIHLNDSHKWTREAIADWLDTLDVDLRFTVT